MSPFLRRVLIVDQNIHMAELLGGCLKTLGAREVTTRTDVAGGLEAVEAMEPTFMVTEGFDDDDPFALVRTIRRSSLGCRQAPIFVLTTLATASAISMAKEAGAHEFIRKPFAPRDIMRRIDQIASHPRNWVEKSAYAGPDRRLFNSGGANRRLSDRVELIGRGVSATSLYLRR